MDKHYTPDLIEFHLGFIFEHKYKDHPVIVDGWGPALVTEGSKLENFQDLINEDRIRVKHLDRSDIEGEVWESTSGVGYRKLFTAEQYRKSTIYMADDEYLYLSTSPTEKENVINIHNGGSHEQADGVRVEIKNLSEFRRILKQIGV